MVVIAAFALALGIALARFYRVFVLLPVTIFVVAGVSIFEWSGAHPVAHASLAVVLATAALQVGFLSASLLGGVLSGSYRTASRAAPRPK